MSSKFSLPAAQPLPDRLVDGADVLSAIRQMVSSAEPAVVFTSLAAVGVPAFCDGCRVDIEEDGAAAYKISHPHPDLFMVKGSTLEDPAWAGSSLGQRIGEHWISTSFRVDAVPGIPGYRGVVVHRWREGFRPGAVEAALARTAVDHAIALISRERLSDQVQTLQRVAANLQYALGSNREIGAAIGILMATHRISQPEAFSLLQVASQHFHRKLRDVAEEVVFTGALELPLTATGGMPPTVSAPGAQSAPAALPQSC